MEALIIPISVELLLFILAGAAAIPSIKKELKHINETLEKMSNTQAAIMETVIRDDERLTNHINNKSLHNNPEEK